jgi:hypothetical protein
MSNDHIHVSKGGITFSGQDAVRLYAATSLRGAIKLHQKCGMIPTRGVTITRMLQAASQYSGKKYKRGEHQKAIDDLTVWIETMKAALPVVNDE